MFARVTAKTPATDILLVAFVTLPDGEQEELWRRLRESRLNRLADEDTQAAVHIRSLHRVCETLGHIPTSKEYKQATDRLAAEGEKLSSQSAIIRFFGSWRLGLEALGLSADNTTLAIEARFRKRLLGRPAEYSETTLRDTLAACIDELGQIPVINDYAAWRRRRVELAKAQGEDIWLPGDNTFRSRYGTWEKALLHFGYAPEEVAARLDPGMRARLAKVAPYRYRAGERWITDKVLETE